MAFNVPTDPDWHATFQESLKEVLRPKKSDITIDKVRRYLEESIDSERAAASFVCGGIASKVPSVRVFWDTANDAEARKLVLPLGSNSTEAASPERLQQLVTDCEPASFGRGQQDVMDPQYRKAGKLDPSRFTSDFCPDELGIVRLAEQYLLPNFSTEDENNLPFRRLKAELYKLNVGKPLLILTHTDTITLGVLRAIRSVSEARGHTTLGASNWFLGRVSPIPVQRWQLDCSP